jgi:membrane protease YdiL (CAAX protease family)
VFVVYGLTLGWLRSRTGNIYPGMLAHGATNAVALTLTFALA